MYLGNFGSQVCAITTNEGKHCPDMPEHYFEHNGKEVGLCNRCYENYQNGNFHKMSTDNFIKIDPMFKISNNNFINKDKF
jgi:uncharacterized membrane protein